MKKLLVNLLKYGISLAIIVWLVIDASRNDAFANLASQPKHWGLLGAAFALCLTAVVLTIVRWHYLVRALDLPFTLASAFRLGFLGYLLNFVSIGAVGGDLFKAVFIAHQLHGRRAQAVATVVIDRIIGLYALFLVASIAILLGGQLQSDLEPVRVLARATLVATGVGAVGIVMLLVPGFTTGAVSELLGNLPRVGPTFAQLILAIRMYRRRVDVLWWSLMMSLATHVLFTIGIAAIARGLPGAAPSLAEHFVIVPLAMVTGVLPLPMSGLGALEAVIDYLYRVLSAGVAVPPGKGFVVAICYRVITIAIAGVGLGYYLTGRREVAEVIHEAEEVEQAASAATHDTAQAVVNAESSV